MHPITILIPTFNEEGYVVDCIESLVNGNYPPERIEILVIDGGSSDTTIQKVLNITSKASIKLLHNPQKIVPCAINLGLAKSSNDIIVWAGAHAIYDPDYLVYSVNILLKENCASVGGVITPTGKTTIGKAIAAATTSKFGIGNAKYRYAKQRQPVDTVFGGCWKKKNILNIGGFNEDWIRNQDYELNFRLRDAIGEIILDPSIKCQYFCRESISSLAKQYFSYGYWRFQTFLKYPNSFTVRQAAPLLLLTGLSISFITAFFNIMLASIVPFSYITASFIAGSYTSIQKNKLSYVILLPVIFATLHISWALGFTKNAVKTLAFPRSNNH